MDAPVEEHCTAEGLKAIALIVSDLVSSIIDSVCDSQKCMTVLFASDILQVATLKLQRNVDEHCMLQQLFSE